MPNNLSSTAPQRVLSLDVDAGLSILNYTKNGESNPTKVADKNWVNLFFWGEFDGATIELKVSPNGAEWFDDADYVKTAKARISTEVLGDCWVKWVVSGVGANTKVSAAVV